jgi:hypothetical protein
MVRVFAIAAWLSIAVFGAACGIAATDSCETGFCLNSFASNIESVCCPADFRFYCNGTNACYATYEDAYFGRSCTLPAERTCF